MNAAIRRTGIGIVVLFIALAAQLTYLQVLRANELENDPGNVRNFLRDITRPRGAIVAADGAVLAESIEVDDEFEFQRTYPTVGLFAHIVGYQSIVYGNIGLEATYNDELVGRDFDIQVDDLSGLLSGTDPTGTIVLSLSVEAQETARAALNGRRGSVVALDAQTGEIVAMYSEPSYDPRPLASHDLDQVRTVFGLLDEDPANPALARAWRERYAPGSTFKVVTTAIALDAGVATPDRDFPRLEELELPQTDRTLQNFGGSRCGGSLVESFRVSCNTTFAQLGLDLGETLAEGVERFGMNTGAPPADLNPRVARSVGPERGSFDLDQPSFAQAGIGQADVALTPLQNAMIAASVANDGVMMAPHVGIEIRSSEGELIDELGPRRWKEAMTPPTAAAIEAMMLEVVERGTGGNAQIPGVRVAGKTGTAQAPGGDPHAWFIGYAPADPAPGQRQYAVAVLIERGGDLGSEATGGRIAAPVAAQVLQVLLGRET